MKIQDIYKLAIKMGTEADFRGKIGVQKLLDSKKQKFDKMSEKDKKEFDKDALENPYLDSGVYNIAVDKDIKKVLVGIDIGADEILIARELGDIDLVIAHHPVGKVWLNWQMLWNYRQMFVIITECQLMLQKV